MMRQRSLKLFVCLAGVCLLMLPAAAGGGAELAAKIAAAHAGTTVSLPAGTFTIAGIDVPPGVSLKGAGYRKTILDVKGEVGLHVKDSNNIVISDLTLRGANTAGIQMDNTQGAMVARVRVLRCLTGIMATGGRHLRLENCLVAENRTGMGINSVAKAVVVNCTLVRNSALGASFSGTKDSAAFNNLLALNAIGVFLARDNQRLAVDHNVYWGALIGKGRDIAMSSLASWRDMEGQDRHSVYLPVDFANADDACKPASPLPWALDRAVTAGWGTAKLSNFTAPARDIDGQPHRQGICAGAWEAPFTAPRSPDGQFTIDNSDGYKSAGLYDKDNHQVAWLFTMLPLAKGTYSYWLPACDWQGHPIPTGNYTLKISEADLHLKYIAQAGNSGITPTSEANASTSIDQVVFDSKDRPILCLHWSESYRQFRAMDADLRHERWMIPGCNDTYGAASDGAGHLYSLRVADGATAVLSRINEETGTYDAVAPGEYGWYIKMDVLGDVRGLAVLNDTVYLASSNRNKVLIGPKFDTGFTVAAPASLCADRRRNLIWLLSNATEVQALDLNGAVKYRFTPAIPGLFSLAVNGNRLALLSPATGKVYLYDITDPATPRALRTIGTGDGPNGPIQPDRFTFQSAPMVGASPHRKVSLDAQGTVAVTDINGVKLFNWDGTAKRDFSGIWGQYIEAGAWEKGAPLELVDQESWRTMLLDEKTRVTRWGTTYGVPAVKGFERNTHDGFFFLRDGKRFGVLPGSRFNKSTVYLIVRYDDAQGTPVLALGPGPDGQLAQFTDFTKNFIDPANWQPVVDGAGKPIPNIVSGWDPLIRTTNGDLVTGGLSMCCLPLQGVDTRGVPVYDYSKYRKVSLLSDANDRSVISPYDYQTKEVDFPGWVRHAEAYPDGSIVSTVGLRKTGHGGGLCNWSGTEVAGFDAKGALRWLQPLAQLKDVEGTKIIDDLTYSVAMFSEVEIFDQDGLFLGSTGAPQELYWGGLALDNTHQFTVLKGNTGKHYVVFGNFNDCTAWWMEVTGRETLKYHALPVVIDAAKAILLAEAAKPPLWRAPVNTTTRVTITRLAAPLPIDGDPAKWRKVIPTPQILITPETAIGGTAGGVAGPADASGLIRLAHEGGNLYVQMLRFDNLVTMHQPVAMFYKQDCLEMSLNSFVKGIKLNITHTRDNGDVIARDGWFLPVKLLDPVRAPRVIKVLDNARDIEERKLIEQIYGVDLSDCKVIITEFKVPLDADTFESRKDAMPAATSGTTMHLGIGLDDNDSPGADLQKMLVWPATYNTFGDVSYSATVVFE